MNFSEVIKKQTAIIAISIIGLSVVLIGTSYALFFKVDKSETQTVKTGTLEITSAGGTKIDEAVYGTGVYPIPEADTATHKSYTFNINNSGTLPSKYNITLYHNPTYFSTAERKATAIDLRFIKVRLDNGTIYKIGDLPTINENGVSNPTTFDLKYVLAENLTIASGANTSHTIEVWISDDAEDDIVDKAISIKIGINGEVNES